MDFAAQETVDWAYIDGRWEAQLGAAHLRVLYEHGRYVPMVVLGDTTFTEYGFTFCIWARWRAEAIARSGSRGGVLP